MQLDVQTGRVCPDSLLSNTEGGSVNGCVTPVTIRCLDCPLVCYVVTGSQTASQVASLPPQPPRGSPRLNGS